MANPGKPELKKPYTSPQLSVYGTVQELTRRTGQTGRGDGAPRIARSNKTHF